MELHRRLTPRYAAALLGMLLPVILVYSSVRTFREIEQMKSVFLRNRTAAIAARLETLREAGPEELRSLAESEPGVLHLRIAESGDPALAEIRNGRELFRTENVSERGTRISRTYIPFHSDGQLRIARIDLDAASADFLLIHARHNVAIAMVSSGVIVLLAAYALWSMHRAALKDRRHLEMAHLAHLGKMSAVLAHEIRTPLATIKGFTQLALEKAGDVRSLLDPVVDEAQRLERLVSDLLLYGRPPAPELRDCSWDEVAALLSGISPVVRIDSSTLRLRTDPELLRHVLTNLARNAVEATAATVKVAVCGLPDTVLITVEDDGPGIPQKAMEKVFESFYTTKAFGTGLGLPIASSLTAALGGSLLLRHRDGGGTVAEVRLPSARAGTVMEATA